MHRSSDAPRPYIFGAIMFLIAFVQFSVGPAVPAVAEQFGVPETALGVAFAFQFSGAFLVLLAGRRIARRFGYDRCLLFFTSLYILAGAAVPLSRSVWLLCSVLFFLGAASVHAQVTVFALIELLYGADGNKYQNLVGSAFAFGAVSGPLFTGLTSSTLGWGTVFWTGAVLGLPIVFWLVRTLPRLRVPQDGPSADPLALRGWFWALSLALIMYLAAESVFNSWLSTYVKEDLGGGPAWQGVSLSLFWTGIALGRLVTSRLTRGMRLTSVVTLCGIAGALAVLAATAATTVPLALALFGVTGLCISGIAPALISLQGRQPRGAERLYLYFALGQLGPMLVPYLAGRVAAIWTFRQAFLLLPVPALIAMMYFLKKAAGLGLHVEADGAA